MCPHSLIFSQTKLNINLISQVLTCPTVWTELILQSELSKPIASGLGYSPSSSTYMFSVNCGPSNTTQLQAKTCTEKCISILKHYPYPVDYFEKSTLGFSLIALGSHFPAKTLQDMGWKSSGRNATLSSKVCTVPWNPGSANNCT